LKRLLRGHWHIPKRSLLQEEYAAYYKEVFEAYKAKDAAKSAELAKKAQDLAKSAQEKMTKMTPEDAKLWADWAQKIATEAAAAAQAQ